MVFLCLGRGFLDCHRLKGSLPLCRYRRTRRHGPPLKEEHTRTPQNKNYIKRRRSDGKCWIVLITGPSISSNLYGLDLLTDLIVRRLCFTHSGSLEEKFSRLGPE